MKILVVYYSKSGNTKKVALDLVAGLGADIEEIIDRKKRRYQKDKRNSPKNYF